MNVCVNVMSEVLQADLNRTQLDDLRRLGKIWICVEHCLPLVAGPWGEGPDREEGALFYPLVPYQTPGLPPPLFPRALARDDRHRMRGRVKKKKKNYPLDHTPRSKSYLSDRFWVKLLKILSFYDNLCFLKKIGYSLNPAYSEEIC